MAPERPNIGIRRGGASGSSGVAAPDPARVRERDPDPGSRIPGSGRVGGCALDDDLGVVIVLWAAASPSLGAGGGVSFPGGGGWGPVDGAVGSALGQLWRTLVPSPEPERRSLIDWEARV